MGDAPGAYREDTRINKGDNMKYKITKLDRQTKTSISALIKCPDVEMASLALEAIYGIDGLTTEDELYVQAVIRIGEYISYRVYSGDTHQQILAILDALDIGTHRVRMGDAPGTPREDTRINKGDNQ